MAYIVYCDDEPIYDLRTDDLLLIDPVVSLELNSAGEFTFKMPPTHPLYDLPQKMTSRILIEQDGDEIFKGRIIKESTDFYKRKEITCEGELAFLNDSIQRPGEYHDITPREYLELLIANHNNQVDEDRQFTVGIVTVEDSNDSLYRYTNMNSTWTEIKEDLVDDLGGYLKVRNENGIRYLDYVNIEDYGNTSSQPIEFGKNLLDFTSDIDMTDICTGIIPLGATLEESDYSALDVRLTIEDVNDGVDYIQIDEAVEEYGLILKTVTWDSVTTASMLLSKAKAYLTDYQWEAMIIEATAIDLHLTDDEFMAFRLGDYIEVISKPHGLDKYFPLSEMKIYLSKPSSNKVTLGETEDESLSAKTSTISSGLSSVSQSVPSSYVSFLQSAVSQATALITAATHGYVMLNDTDDDGYPDELVIMDTDDTETATNVWRWNLNGLGYSSTGYNGTYGTAITMDGQIVGSYIAAGTISAEQLSVEYTSSVEEEISNAILEGKEYTDDELTNYYTISTIDQLFETNNGTLLSTISQTYVTTTTYTTGLSDTLSSAESYADSAASNAESSANTYTDECLVSYSTTAELESIIEQTSSSILLSVSESYVTTTTYTTGLSDTLSSAESYADSAASNAESSANTYTDECLVSYSTTAELESIIEQTSSSILLSVSESYVTTTTYTTGLSDTLETVQSSVRSYFAMDSTSVTIDSGTITFNSDTFVVNSDYLTITSTGTLTATNANVTGTIITKSGDLKTTLSAGGIYFYYNDNVVTRIRSSYSSSNYLCGTQFLVTSDADYLSFSLYDTDAYCTVIDLNEKDLTVQFGATYFPTYIWGSPLYINGDAFMYEKGSVSITPEAANTPTYDYVTFQKTFSSTPTVVATPKTQVPGTTLLGVGVYNITTTGFYIYITRTNTTTTAVNWIAIGT